MKKANKKSKYNLPKYPKGGFLKDTGDFLANAGRAAIDTPLTMLGASNVIKDDSYTGAGSGLGKFESNTIGGAGKALLPMAANIAFPGSGMAVSAAQGAIGQFNPQDPNQVQQNQQQGQGQQFGNMAMQGMQMANMMGAFRKGGIQSFYPEGGTANAQIEKQENFITPQGEFGQADGPAHEQGGVDLNLPQNTIIFSDKLKPEGSKKTFADLNKPNNTKKEDKILDDKFSTNEAKTTAKFMDKVKKSNSDKLFQEQEALKNLKLQASVKRAYMRYRGSINMYPFGGPTVPTTGSDTGSAMNTMSNRPSWRKAQEAQGYTQVPGFPDRYYNPSNYQYFDYEQPQSKTPMIDPNHKPIQFGSNMNYNPNQGSYTNPQGQPVQTSNFTFRKGGVNIYPDGGWQTTFLNSMKDSGLVQSDPNFQQSKQVGQLDQLPSGFSNQSLQGASQDSFNDQSGNGTNFNIPNWKNATYQGAGTLAQSAGQLAYLHDQGKKYDTQQFYNYTPQKLDPSAALRDADLQSNAARYDIANASGGNSGSYLANRVALAGTNTMNKAGIRTQYDNLNAQIGNQGQEFNIQNRYKTDDINAQRKGQMLSNYYNTIGSLGNNVASSMKDYRADKYDQQAYNALPGIYNSPEFQRTTQGQFGNQQNWRFDPNTGKPITR